MDLISKAIKCSICNSVLNSPVILPCEHNICQNHVQDVSSIQCGECGQEHCVPSNGRFPSNKPLSDIIQARIESLNFGKHHSAAKSSCIQLDELLRRADLTIKDPNNFIYEKINSMREKVG